MQLYITNFCYLYNIFFDIVSCFLYGLNHNIVRVKHHPKLFSTLPLVIIFKNKKLVETIIFNKITIHA